MAISDIIQKTSNNINKLVRFKAFCRQQKHLVSWYFIVSIRFHPAGKVGYPWEAAAGEATI